MPKSISTSLIVSLMGVFALAMALVVFISFHKFENAFESVINDRYVFVLKDVQGLLNTELGVGIPLESLSQAQNVLDSAAKANPAILSIEAFNIKGQTLYSTDRSYVGDFVSKSWERAAGAAGNDYWTVKERDGVALGINLTNSAGMPIGGLVIRYSIVGYENTIDEFVDGLVGKAGLLWTVAAALMIVMVLAFTRHLKAYVAGLLGVVSSLTEDGRPAGKMPELSAESGSAGDFAHGYTEAELHLDHLQEELRRIDEEM